ncbi:MAG: FkbM family methyltransferase [Pyrinomonadaceae bacterium]|nr:FkbM family methyltransferase [Sphingobacteriaceae bacterium]
MMKSWRLNWTLEEIFTSQNYSNHVATLKSSWRFWFALVVKFIPGLWKGSILLRLKEGGAFYVKNFMTLYIYKEIFVDKCYDYPLLFEQKPVIIDIGANTGLFSLRMKQLYPDSQIYCYEPFHLNFEQLSSNTKASNLSNIEIFNCGVGGVSRKEKLYTHQSNLGGHSIIQSETNSNEFTEINLIAIQDIFESLKISNCNLLKMDCEGAEFEIIKSIDIKLAASIEKIIFEPTKSAYNVDELTEHLENIGFKMVHREGICVAINISSFDEIFETEEISQVA